MKNKLEQPLGIEIKLTNKCNSRCIHCITNSTYNDSREISPSEFKIIINKIKQSGIFHVGLTGGEPLLCRHIFLFAKLLKQNHFSVGITTNALLIDDTIARKISQASIDLVRISLDGSTEEMNDYFRGIPGHFKQVKKAVKLLSRYNINPVILSVISKYNIKHLEDIIKTAIRFGAKSINCYSLVSAGRAIDLNKYIFDPDEYLDFLRQIKFLKKKYSKQIAILTETPLMNLIDCDNHVCLAGRAQLFIKENGDVVPCPYMSNYIVGNIYRDEISKIWGSRAMVDLVDTNFLDKACQNCERVSSCFGGCRAAAYSKFGTIKAKDPFCAKEPHE